MNVNHLNNNFSPRKKRWQHVELLKSADERPYYKDGDLMLCADGSVNLGPKSYPPGRPIRDSWNGIRIYRPRGSNKVQIEALAGERRYYTYQRVFLWWRWRQSFLGDRPPSLFRRLIAIRS